MTSAKQRLAMAAERADQDAYRRESDGRLVDPIPVQKVAIEEGFKMGAEDPEFDIWTVVRPSILVEGETVYENMQRVYDQWQQTLDNPELEAAVQRIIEEQKQEDGGGA